MALLVVTFASIGVHYFCKYCNLYSEVYLDIPVHFFKSSARTQHRFSKLDDSLILVFLVPDCLTSQITSGEQSNFESLHQEDLDKKIGSFGTKYGQIGIPGKAPYIFKHSPGDSGSFKFGSFNLCGEIFYVVRNSYSEASYPFISYQSYQKNEDESRKLSEYIKALRGSKGDSL
ncbi:MAG: hypothetical protein KC652_03480 [Cyanobacteria bacterium HKST-UBA01]|nr:hypothetical protein [Cyanobacteria bacterium HKST-UBA01]